MVLEFFCVGFSEYKYWVALNVFKVTANYIFGSDLMILFGKLSIIAQGLTWSVLLRGVQEGVS